MKSTFYHQEFQKNSGKTIFRDAEPYNDLPLEGERFDVFGGADFREKWVMILRDAGGQLVDSNSRSVKYILCDGNPEGYEIKIAKDKKLPLLLPEWAIQTLISGSPVDEDDEESYVLKKSSAKKNSHGIENSPKRASSKDE